MALRTVHLCPFGFQSTDPVVINSEVDGGTSLNGISDVDYNDGGGFWQWSLGSATFGGRGDDKRDKTLAWRAFNAGLSGGQPAIFKVCDRYHQPVYGLKTVPHDDDTPFDDSTEYASPGAECTVVSVDNGQIDGLNATIITISLASERPLRGGERFGYVGANGWGERLAEISSVTQVGANLQITFQPPIRGGIAVGDALNFDEPKCVMRRASQPTNALNPFSLTTTVQTLTLVEYMLPVPA